MKKIFILILIVAAILFYFFRDSKVAHPPLPKESGTFQPDPSGATFAFDDGSVTLSSGQGEKEAEDGMFSESVELLDENAYGDLNADGKNDSVVLLARSGGGSGVFIYIAAYISGPVSYKGTNAIFVGDRISPQSISIASGTVTLDYLDRSPDEAFASEPTVPASEQYVYKDGAFREK